MTIQKHTEVTQLNASNIRKMERGYKSMWRLIDEVEDIKEKVGHVPAN